MPRNVTVTFNDGSSHIYQNVPDGLTPGQVAARATSEFSKPIQNIDGGNQAAPARKTTATRNAPAVPVTTRAQEVQNIAKGYVDRSEAGDFAPTGLHRFNNAMSAGLNKMLLDIPNRLGAVADYFAGSPYRKDHSSPQSYADALAERRAVGDEEMNRSTGGKWAGILSGGVASGSAEAKLAGFVGSKLAASGLPVVGRIGNVLQELATFRKGQNVRNAAKLASAGAAGGAAQGAAESTPIPKLSDIKSGAETGAAGAVLLGAGGKIAGTLIPKIVRTIARPASKDVGKAIRETITENPADIEARRAGLEAQTGAPVPTVAALSDQDFGNVAKKVLQKSPDALQIAKGKTGDYIRGFMDRMLAHVNNAGQAGGAQQFNAVGDLAQIRKDTADSLIAPIRDNPVDFAKIPLDKLEKSVTQQIGGRMAGVGDKLKTVFAKSSPDDLANLGLSGDDLATAQNLLQHWGLSKPGQANITVGEADALRRTLNAAGKSSAGSNPANALAYRNAAKVIGDHVGDQYPAYKTMVDGYAAHSRMIEGFDAASKGQRPADIVDDQLRANLQTPEGIVGQKAGELYKLRTAATNKPTSAISLAKDLASEGNLTRPKPTTETGMQGGTVTQNLGQEPAANLTNAATGETAVLDRMLDTSKVNAMGANEEGALSPGEIAFGAMLHSAHPATQARFLSRLIEKLPSGFNPDVAKNMTDMLYSGDAAKTQTVMNALQKTGVTKKILGGLLQDAGTVGSTAGAVNTDAQAPGQAPVPVAPAVNDIPELDESGTGGDAVPAGGEAPAAPQNFSPRIDAPAGIPQYDSNGAPLVGLTDNGSGGQAPQYGSPDQPDAFKVDPTQPYGRQVVQSLFPQAKITDDVRDPNSALGKKTPNSYHEKTQNAVDVEPIDGMNFNDFIAKLHDNGHQIIEAIDEVNHPSKNATGPHWHVVVG